MAAHTTFGWADQRNHRRHCPTAKGQIGGAALRPGYRLKLPDDAGRHLLGVTDGLYLMPHGMILNRPQTYRFAIATDLAFAFAFRALPGAPIGRLGCNAPVGFRFRVRATSTW